MEKIGREIRRRRRLLGITIDQLVERIDRLGGKANQGNISRIELDKQGCSLDTLSYIARALECKVADLYLGSEGFVNVSTVTSGALKKVPIINHKQAVDLNDIFNGGTHDVDEWVTTEAKCSKRTFALRIKGNSMEGKFSDGDLVVIDPEVKPDPGDFVAAKGMSDEVTFRKYRPRGINEDGVDVFELVPLNDDYPIVSSTIVELAIVGVMIEHRIYRKERQ